METKASNVWLILTRFTQGIENKIESLISTSKFPHI